MWMLAVLLAAADVVSLTQEAQVKDLCAALQAQTSDPDLDPAEAAGALKAAAAKREEAASRWYRLEVPPKGFAFGRYRAQDNQLELDGDRPLRAVDGTLSVDLDGIDDVAFSATAAQVSAWSRAKKAGTLKLRVVFKPSGDRCAGSAAAEAWRLAGKARSWELVDADRVVASADAEGEPVSGPPHAVRVEKVSLDSDEAPREDEGRTRLSQAQAALDRCGARAQRLGTILLTFNVEGGRIRDPQVMMDSLRDEKVAGCFARAVSGAEVGGSGHGTASITLE